MSTENCLSMKFPPEHSVPIIEIYMKSVLFGLDQVNGQYIIYREV